MKNKFILWGLIAMMSVIILPSTTLASSEKTTSNVAISESSATTLFQRRGRGRGRGRDDNWNRGRRGRHNMRRGHGRTRVVRQVYYRNGRRYVRTVRIHR